MKSKILNHLNHYKRLILICQLFSICFVLGQNKVQVNLEKTVALRENVKFTVFNFEDENTIKFKVEVYDRKIIFYDKVGHIFATKNFKNKFDVLVSDNGQFVHVSTISKNPTKYEVGERKNYFFDIMGKSIFSNTTPFYYDYLSPYFIISNNGAIVGLDSGSGNLKFYNKSGEVIKKVNFYQAGHFEAGFSNQFSRDGNLLLVGVTYPYSELQQRSLIVLYDLLGNEIWRYRTKQTNISDLFISPNNHFVICSSFDEGVTNKTTYILNAQNGEFLSEITNALAREVSFYVKDLKDYVLINDTGNRILNTNLFDSKVESVFTIPSYEKILGVEIDSNNKIICVAKGTKENILLPTKRYSRVFSKPYIEFYDLKGNSVGKQDIPARYIEEYLSADNQMSFINKGNKLLIYLREGKKLLAYDIKVR